MDTETTTNSGRDAAVQGLAIVGFIALVALGMWLAIYFSRYVPAAVGRLGSAATYVSSIFIPKSPSSHLVVVPPTATSTGSAAATSTTPSSSPATPTTKPAPVRAGGQPSGTGSSVAREPGQQSASAQVIGSGQPSYYGLPDLAVTIEAVGYLTSSSTSSFVAATTVPHGAIPAVKFMVKNVGTNVAGPWRFSASIPTATNYLYQSVPQQSLNPGDYIDYTLGFSQPLTGTNKTITITANYDHSVTESNTNNDTATAQVTILGS